MQEESDRSPGRRPNAQRSEEMKARLIAAARALFVEKGFAETGTPEIVRAAEVTRGALYHHFADKTDLFRAVARAEAAALREEIDAKARATSGAGDALEAGTAAFFEAMAAPGRCRVLLVEGPAVLGPDEMDAIDAGGGRASLADGIRAARPELSETDVAALALLLSAAFDRAALAISGGTAPAPLIDALGVLVTGATSAL